MKWEKSRRGKTARSTLSRSLAVGNSLAVPWLGLSIISARDFVQSLVEKLRSHKQYGKNKQTNEKQHSCEEIEKLVSSSSSLPSLLFYCSSLDAYNINAFPMYGEFFTLWNLVGSRAHLPVLQLKMAATYFPILSCEQSKCTCHRLCGWNFPKVYFESGGAYDAKKKENKRTHSWWAVPVVTATPNLREKLWQQQYLESFARRPLSVTLASDAHHWQQQSLQRPSSVAWYWLPSCKQNLRMWCDRWWYQCPSSSPFPASVLSCGTFSF